MKSVVKNQEAFIPSVVSIVTWCVLCILIVIYRHFFVQQFNYGFMLWNLFLAVVPFMLSCVLDYMYFFGSNSRKITLLLLFIGAVWLLFYPNAAYLMTDLIHLNTSDFIINTPTGIEYNNNPSLWYDFVMLMFFGFLGIFIGFISLYIIQQVVKSHYSKTWSWIFSAAVLVLTSFGVYLGRFIRLNSWDIFSDPLKLIKQILDSLGPRTWDFMLFFSLFLIFSYLMLYSFTFLRRVTKS